MSVPRVTSSGSQSQAVDIRQRPFPKKQRYQRWLICQFRRDPQEAWRQIDEEGAALPWAHRNRDKWKKASRICVWETTCFLLFFVLLQLFGCLYLRGSQHYSLWLFLPAGMLFCCEAFHRAVFKIVSSHRLTKNRYTVLLNSGLWHVCLHHCYLQIWSIRHIWLWMLLATTARVEMDFVNSQTGEINGFAKDLLSSLVISLIAYIATNVVREMLQMRIRYQNTVQQVEQMDSALRTRQESIEEHNETSRKTSEEFRRNADIIVATTSVAGVSGLLRQLLEDNSDIVLSGLIKAAFKNIGEEASAISDRIKNMPTADKSRFQQMYLRVLNPYVEAELREFAKPEPVVNSAGRSKERGIVTRFTVAGQMVRSLLQAEGLDVTFHALLVIPPARFLNYFAPKGFVKKWDTLSGGDINWEAYLAANQSVASGDVVKRQFLVVQSSSEVEAAKLPPEVRPLERDLIKAQLNLFVLCKDRLPLKIEWSNGTPKTDSAGEYIAINGEADGRKWRYLLRETEESGEWRRLADVIGTVFHKPGNCRVREITASNYLDPSNELGKLLRDRDTEKPFDYFAVRDRGTNDWLLCLQMRYDKDFDVAILEIFYPGSVPEQEWDGIKYKLSELFDVDPGTCPEITEYAKS